MSTILAYTAGLVDGEGSLGLEPQSGSRFRGPYLSFPSTSKQLVYWMSVNHPGGHVTGRRGRKVNHCDSWVWKIRGDRALALMSELLPYLQEPSKKARAQLLVAEYKQVTRRNGQYSAEQLAAKLDLQDRIMALNTRGHTGEMAFTSPSLDDRK